MPNKYFDSLSDRGTTEGVLSDKRYDSFITDEINNLPAIPVNDTDRSLHERAGFVPDKNNPGNMVTPSRRLVEHYDQKESERQQRLQQEYQDTKNSTLFKVGDTLADAGRLFLSPLFWLSGEDTTKYDPSAMVDAGYKQKMRESEDLRVGMYRKLLDARDNRLAKVETLNTNRVTRAKSLFDMRLPVSTEHKALLDFANYSGEENLALYNANTPDAFNQLQKNMMLATDKAIPLFGVDGSQIIVPKMMNDTFNKYGTRFEQAVAPANEAFSALDKLRTSLKEGTPLSEVAAVTQFNKVLDPGSVVRESEVRLTAEARGIYDELMVKLNNVSEGDVLTDDQVIDMLSLADALGDVYKKSYNRTRDDAEFKFSNSGYGDKNVITQYLGSRKSFEAPTTDSTNSITVPDPQPFGSGQGPLRPDLMEQIEPSDDQLFQNDLLKYYKQ
jgi:hypothetical protein